MAIEPAAKIMLAAMLAGSLGCASFNRDHSALHAQRSAELDRLDQQAGMPDSYRAQGLDQARAYLAARNRAPAPSPEAAP